jgi:AcrR family transcriptional regulator
MGKSNATKTAATKTALLDAAKELLGERGYAGASVRELAAAAGTTFGAVNYHFGSREKLLNEAILELFLEWANRAGEQGPADPDAEGLAQLAARARAMVDGIPEMQPLFVVGLEALLQSRRSEELHEQLAGHYTKLRQIAIGGMQATKRGSELPHRFLEVAASYMIAVADGLQIQALLDPDVIPTGEELAFMYEALAAVARAEGAAEAGAVSDSP